ncbi:MAG: hypothetical protein ACREUQ_02375 [Burkholderiales bacterium]
MRTTHQFVFALILLAIPACPAGCPTPPRPGDPDAGVHVGIVDCSAQTIRDHALSLIPFVNDCLIKPSYSACLLALIDPAVGITIDVIGCVVNARQNGFSANVAANPNDTVSLTAAKNAGNFIREQGLKFEP